MQELMNGVVLVIAIRCHLQQVEQYFHRHYIVALNGKKAIKQYYAIRLPFIALTNSILQLNYHLMLLCNVRFKQMV